MKIYNANENRTELESNVYKKIEQNIGSSDLYIYYGYPFIELDNTRFNLKSIILCKCGIFVFYNTEAEKKKFKRFINKLINDDQEIYDICEENDNSIIYYNEEEVDDIIEKINNNFEIFNSDNLLRINCIIQKTFGLIKKDDRKILNENSLGNLIKLRNNKLKTFDENQFKMIYNDNNKNIRIRGLAGSGKTILLVKKMAYLHYKNPELKMAYVFYTLSLKQFVKELFIKFYRDFDQINMPNLDNILFLHSWGGKMTEGFYSHICNNFNIQSKTVSEVDSQYNKFGKVCNELIEEIKNFDKVGIFDKIFVDEAQDFPIEFFKLARRVLNVNGNIIYAYDELQSLNENGTNMPSKKEIFGHEECIDINLNKCYRTPNKILVTAHALGLGIYNIENGEVKFANMIQDTTVWEAIGYNNALGDIKTNKKVSLYRDDLIEEELDEPIKFSILPKSEQYEYVINEIYELLHNQDVFPEDILIIDLDTLGVNQNYSEFRQRFYEKFVYDKEKNKYEANVHIVNKTHAVDFKVDNSITYTTIFRAKGNEANIVFILNADSLLMVKSFSRNKLFTAMTRSKFKVYIIGDQKVEKYVEEYDLVKTNDYKLVFKYPSKNELSKLQLIAKEENKTANEILKFNDTFKNLSSNKELLKKFLLSQTGKSNYEEFIDYIKELFSNEN